MYERFTETESLIKTETPSKLRQFFYFFIDPSYDFLDLNYFKYFSLNILSNLYLLQKLLSSNIGILNFYFLIHQNLYFFIITNPHF